MMFLDKLFSKRTDFKAGGLILDGIPASATQLKDPTQFVAPRKLDFRDMCIQTSNQFQTPHCAGYATAGYIEVQNWKTKHYPEQVDGDRIYNEAKKIDNNSFTNGTNIQFAVQAAINMGLISGGVEYVLPDRQKLKFAIHENTVCVGCFLISDEWNNVSRGGVIPISTSPNIIGGHAVLICGYDPDGIYIQNSWGSTWGLFGFAMLPWEIFDRQFANGIIIRKS